MERDRSRRRPSVQVTVGLAATLVASSASPVWGQSTAPAPSAAPRPAAPAGAASSEPAPSGPAAPRPSASGPAGAGVPAVLTRCQYEVAAAEILVAAARPGVANWAAHVGAGADRMAGRATRAEVRPIYRRTKAAAPRDAARYSSAAQTYRAPGRQCTQLSADGLPGQYRAAARDCAQRAQVLSRAARAGDEAIGQWVDHAHAMDRHKSGRLSRAAHLAMRHDAIYEATDALQRFRQADRQLDTAPDCSVPGAQVESPAPGR